MSALERIQISAQDITALQVDGIVNAANSALRGGGGVDGAIHKAAGPELLKKCLSLQGCPTGSAVITDGYNLPAKYVIHAVGPIWHGGHEGEPDKLRSCYRTSLELARDQKLNTLAFSAISCGVYGYPHELAAQIAIGEIIRFLESEANPHQVTLVCFNASVRRAYEQALKVWNVASAPEARENL